MTTETTTPPETEEEKKPSLIEKRSKSFARSNWSQALALAEQLRKNTEVQKNEQLRKFAFNIPSTNEKESVVKPSVQAQAYHVQYFQNELLFAKTGNFNLDNLSEKFVDLKRTFNRMLELNKNDLQQVKLATSITKTALLMVFRATESIVEIVTKGTRKYPSLSSIISFIRSRHIDLPINGKLLVDWYTAATTLDLLVNDPDWLVQPRKAHWAMQVCSETMAWARAVFNESYRRKSTLRAIFDRDDSICMPEPT